MKWSKNGIWDTRCTWIASGSEDGNGKKSTKYEYSPRGAESRGERPANEEGLLLPAQRTSWEWAFIVTAITNERMEGGWCKGGVGANGIAAIPIANRRLDRFCQ